MRIVKSSSIDRRVFLGFVRWLVSSSPAVVRMGGRAQGGYDCSVANRQSQEAGRASGKGSLGRREEGKEEVITDQESYA